MWKVFVSGWLVSYFFKCGTSLKVFGKCFQTSCHIPSKLHATIAILPTRGFHRPLREYTLLPSDQMVDNQSLGLCAWGLVNLTLQTTKMTNTIKENHQTLWGLSAFDKLVVYYTVCPIEKWRKKYISIKNFCDHFRGHRISHYCSVWSRLCVGECFL